MEHQPPHFAKDVPLHHQIYELLRADIMDGLYVGCDNFAGETELAGRFGVSVATSRAVLQRLAAEGLIERGRGRRTEAVFVPYTDAVTPLIANIDLFTFRLLDVAEVVAPWAACRMFGLPAGSVLWRCLRLRLADGQPHSVTYSYEVPEIGRRHSADAVASLPLPRMLEVIGVPATRIECMLSVRRPTAEVSAALDIVAWDKVLMSTLIQASGDRPVDFTRIYYHPHHQHAMDMVAQDIVGG